MKKFAFALIMMSISACATGANPGAMRVSVSEERLISETSPIHQAIRIGQVGGGKQTNPLWASKVSSEDFAEALRQSFSAHALLAVDGGQYRLDAELLKLKQPFIGASMKVTSRVAYTLTDVSSGEIVLAETVDAPYTAKMSDAFIGVERLRLANEGSIKNNISSIIELLIDRLDG